MDFENEKKQEETPKEGFQREQREFRPGRSPRPRIHNGQRPAYERPSYNNHEEDEGGFRPEGFGAGLQSNAPQRPSYRPRTGGYNNGYQPRLAVSSVGGISPVSRVKAVISLANPVRAVMVSRAVIRLVAISRVRAVTTRTIPISPSNPLRRTRVPIRPTMTRMPSIV